MTVIGENTPTYVVELPEAPDEAVELAWALATDTGHRRQHNEDSAVVAPPFFVVADGMGGHAGGDRASDAVVRRFAELATTTFAESAQIETALLRATVDIGEVVDEASLGVGTTATGVALVLVDGRPHWSVFNVGDSRSYIVDGGVLEQLTVDHSVVQELVDAGLLSEAEAEHHPDSNIITRAVGFNAEPIPDFWLVPLIPGTRLLICSDGLNKELDHARIEEILTTGGDAEAAAEELVMSALAAGGRDNVTVIVIDVVAAPSPPETTASDELPESDDDTSDTIPRGGAGRDMV